MNVNCFLIGMGKNGFKLMVVYLRAIDFSLTKIAHQPQKVKLGNYLVEFAIVHCYSSGSVWFVRGLEWKSKWGYNGDH